jgi:lipoprotein-releasing system ATP-binding protein
MVEVVMGLISAAAESSGLGSAEAATGVRPGPTLKHPIHNNLPAIRVEGLRKEYASPAGKLVLFDSLNFAVSEGEMVAIVGESGAGKSTLMHILAALDAPTAGQVYCGTKLVTNMGVEQAADFRNRELGYVWQAHYLLPEFTAAENVAMPLLAGGEKKQAAMSAAREWLREVGLAHREEHRAGELSGGEQQRVALARALVGQPKLLLADEPTGNLDNRTAESVFQLIERLHEQHRLTSILVTHNAGFAARCGRVLRLEGGSLQQA